MPPVFRILLGIVVMIWGFHMVWKTVFYFDIVGRIPFAENKFGHGGTDTFLKLFGIGMSFLGIFIITNIISDILGAFASIFVR
jgi:hypothetical protein